MSDRGQQLLEEGFERISTRAVGVAHFVWKVDLEIELDRELRLVEETILRLVAAGVEDPVRIKALMGLTDERMVLNGVVELLRKDALRQRDGLLKLSPSGAAILRRSAVRETRWYEELELRHDPYRDELRWGFDEREYKTSSQLREAGLVALPAPTQLSPQQMEGRYQELQALLEREGLPFQKAEEREKQRREVLRIRALKMYVAYREAELEIWHRDGAFRWRLLRGGGDEPAISDKLAELETEEKTIIPLEDQKEPEVGATGQEIHQTLEVVRRNVETTVLQTSEHREALREAIFGATRELIIVSPWLRTSAVDGELLGWFRTALDRNKALKIVIGYGIERAAGKQKDPALRDQEDALNRLKRLAQQTGGRLRIVEIGNTHEKVVICDDRYVIITSFNFLSFKPRPGKGIRREMGNISTDPKVVADVRAGILPLLASNP